MLWLRGLIAALLTVLVTTAGAQLSLTGVGQGGIGGGGGVTFNLSYVTTATDATSQTTYNSFTTQSIGSADANRTVIIGVIGRSATTTLDISSVSIGGSAATLVKKQKTTPGGTTTVVGLYRLAVAAGTTADVVVTFNEASLRCAIAVWRVVTATPIETATNSSAVDPSPLNLTIPVGGGAVVFAAGAGATSYTPLGYTENVDAVIGASTTVYTVGTNTSSSGATTITVTAATAPTDPAGVSAAWGN